MKTKPKFSAVASFFVCFMFVRLAFRRRRGRSAGDLARRATRLHAQREALVMSVLTPHVTLTGFGYLEPLARQTRTTATLGRPKTWTTEPLTRKHAAITERLSARSNWMRASPNSPPRQTLSPLAYSVDLSLDSISSDYARSGVWPANRPPLPSMARSPRSTAQQRRRVNTKEWHMPPSPHELRHDAVDDPRAWASSWRINSRGKYNGAI